MELNLKIFQDRNGNVVGFIWWLKWKIAYWHLRKCLEYEGMPRGTKEYKDVGEWHRKLIKVIIWN